MQQNRSDSANEFVDIKINHKNLIKNFVKDLSQIGHKFIDTKSVTNCVIKPCLAYN